MPLWVREHAGTNPSGKKHGQVWFGPYDDRRLLNIRTFARIGSAHGTPRDLIWEPAGCRLPARLQVNPRAIVRVAGGCEAVRVRTYKLGARAFPVTMTPVLREHEVAVIVGKRRGDLRHLKGLR